MKVSVEPNDICHLCEQKATLKLSHVIPRFVWKRFKHTSPTGLIRFGLNPNKLEQDGYKIYLLCECCEQRFNRYETTFAEEIFIPLHEEQDSKFRYGPWLEKFAVSISWRVLTFLKLKNALSSFPSNLIPAIDRALRTWKDFLLDRRENPGRFEQHMVPLGPIIKNNDMDMPPNMNRYFLRSVDIDVAHSPIAVFVYTKMCRILLMGFIEMPNPRDKGEDSAPWIPLSGDRSL